jgi:transcriptional regulator with XRE-family HTH domain
MDVEGAPNGRALADSMGVREQAVSNWRAGKHRPEGEQLVRLAVLLRVSPETLRGDDQARISASDLPRAAPFLLSPMDGEAQYWQGVLYAAEAMSETVTRLLREQREATIRYTPPRMPPTSEPEQP